MKLVKGQRPGRLPYVWIRGTIFLGLRSSWLDTTESCTASTFHTQKHFPGGLFPRRAFGKFEKANTDTKDLNFFLHKTPLHSSGWQAIEYTCPWDLVRCCAHSLLPFGLFFSSFYHPIFSGCSFLLFISLFKPFTAPCNTILLSTLVLIFPFKGLFLRFFTYCYFNGAARHTRQLCFSIFRFGSFVVFLRVWLSFCQGVFCREAWAGSPTFWFSIFSVCMYKLYNSIVF